MHLLQQEIQNFWMKNIKILSPRRRPRFFLKKFTWNTRNLRKIDLEDILLPDYGDI